MGIHAGLFPSSTDMFNMATLSQVLLQNEVTEEHWNATPGICVTEYNEGMPLAGPDSANIDVGIGNMAPVSSAAITTQAHDRLSSLLGNDDPFAGSDPANNNGNSHPRLTGRVPSAISMEAYDDPPSPLSSLSDSDVHMDDIASPKPTTMEPPTNQDQQHWVNQ